MKMRKYFGVLILFGIFVSSCEFNTQRFNNNRDKKEGEKVVEAYFNYENLGKSELAKNLFSKAFIDEVGFAKFLENQNYLNNKLGKVLDKELKSWETAVVSGTNSKSEYLFVYEVKREKHNSFETFYLVKEESDSIKIRKYNLESEGLLQPD